MQIRTMIGVLAVAVTCFAGTLPAGVERFYDVGFRADLEFLGPGREERLDLYFPKNPATGEYFPSMYNFDPFTGESLEWAKRD